MTSLAQEAPTLESLIGRLPRHSLAFLPTPLHRLDRLSQSLGIELWMKRDDQTGLALGGNKARKLEFLMGDALEKESDIIITTGGSQSNHARITAAACRLVDLECYLVLDRGRHPSNGNLLLDHFLGANVELIEDSDPAVAAARMAELADEFRQAGRNPYVIPRGGSVPAGAVGYAAMVGELVDQLREIGLDPDHLYLATGSCGTHSGVMAGRAVMNAGWRVQGVSVSRPQVQQESRVLDLSNELLGWLSSSATVQAEDVHVDGAFAGPAYGVPTTDTWKAVRRLALDEAILIDPVYTGKAMSCLLDHVESGRVARGSAVVFVHTGGAPALFGYADEAESALS